MSLYMVLSCPYRNYEIFVQIGHCCSHIGSLTTES